MSVHQGIDLSRFRKVSSDGKTTTLRHAKGHEVKIAHGALSDKMREHINGMPQFLAEGEEVAEPIPDEPKKYGGSMGEMEAADAAEAPPPAQQQPMPDQSQQAGPQQVSAQEPIDDTSPDAKMAEHMKFASDVASGQIKPKTYSDLFADKSTLGKVGTIFGLLVGGAGAGLTHQPNMLMEMMNKEIERDIEKQKHNIENSRNFMSLQYQHNLQKAQIAEHQMNVLQKQVDTAPKAAATGNVLENMTKNGTSPFLSNYNKVAQNIWANFEGPAKVYEAVGDHLDKITQNNPVANAVVKNTIKQVVQKKVADLHAQGAAEVANGTKDLVRTPAVNPDVANNVHFANINPNDMPLINDETAKVTGVRNAVYDYYNAFNVLKDLPFAGQAPGLTTGATILGTLAHGLTGGGANAAAKDAEEYFERARTQQFDSLVDKMFRGGMSKDQAIDLAKSFLPHYADTLNPKLMRAAFDQGMQHFRDLYAAPTLERYNKNFPGFFNPFPKLPYVAPKVQPASGQQTNREGSSEKPSESKKSGGPKGLGEALMNTFGIKYKPAQ